MPKEKIIKEQISRIEEQPLQAGEIQQLKDKLYKQVILYLPGYLLLLTGALIIFLNAPASYKTVARRPAELDEEDVSRMWRLAPYFSAFVVLMATIFFGRIYYQSILPILRDLKSKTKSLLFYKPQKNAMPVFNRYYLSIPLFVKRQIQVENHDFHSISDSDEVCLETTKNSFLILALKKDGKNIKYQELVGRS